MWHYGGFASKARFDLFVDGFCSCGVVPSVNYSEGMSDLITWDNVEERQQIEESLLVWWVFHYVIKTRRSHRILSVNGQLKFI